MDLSFLDLPVELRMQIYTELFGRDSHPPYMCIQDLKVEGIPGEAQLRLHSQFLRTCKTICTEAKPVLYRSWEFAFNLGAYNPRARTWDFTVQPQMPLESLTSIAHHMTTIHVQVRTELWTHPCSPPFDFVDHLPILCELKKFANLFNGRDGSRGVENVWITWLDREYKNQWHCLLLGIVERFAGVWVGRPRFTISVPGLKHVSDENIDLSLRNFAKRSRFLWEIAPCKSLIFEMTQRQDQSLSQSDERAGHMCDPHGQLGDA